MLNDIYANFSNKDLATLPDEAAVRNPGATVVHFLSNDKQQRQTEVESLHHVLTGHDKEFVAIEALEDGACSVNALLLGLAQEASVIHATGLHQAVS